MNKERNALEEIAGNLLICTGGGTLSLYFTILDGRNSDDVVGMTVNSTQLFNWANLPGRKPSLVVEDLSSRRDESPKAFGLSCYSKETLAGILYDITLQQTSTIAA